MLGWITYCIVLHGVLGEKRGELGMTWFLGEILHSNQLIMIDHGRAGRDGWHGMDGWVFVAETNNLS